MSSTNDYLTFPSYQFCHTEALRFKLNHQLSPSFTASIANHLSSQRTFTVHAEHQSAMSASAEQRQPRLLLRTARNLSDPCDLPEGGVIWQVFRPGREDPWGEPRLFVVVDEMTTSTVVIIHSTECLVACRIEHEAVEGLTTEQGNATPSVAARMLHELRRFYTSRQARMQECAAYLIYATSNGTVEGDVAAPREVRECESAMIEMGLPCNITKCAYLAHSTADIAAREAWDASGTIWFTAAQVPRLYLEDREATASRWEAHESWISTGKGLLYQRVGIGGVLFETETPPASIAGIWIPFRNQDNAITSDVMVNYSGTTRVVTQRSRS